LFDQLNNPLFLRIAVSAARQIILSPATLPSEVEYRDLLFEAYVRKMLDVDLNGPKEADLRLLETVGWIASTMRSARLSIFIPELIQPSVLKTPFRIWLVTSGLGILASVALTTILLLPTASLLGIPLDYFVGDYLVGPGLTLNFYFLYALSGDRVSNYYQLKWSWRKFKGDLRHIQLYKRFPLLMNPFEAIILRILDLGFEEVVSTNRVSVRRKWIRNGFYAGRRATLVVLMFWLAFVVFAAVLLLVLGANSLTLSGFFLLSVVVLVFFLLSVPAVALRRGPSDWIRYMAIKLLLCLTARIPMRLEAVCEEAARISLLKSVGGGYVFAHNLLQDFFIRRFAPKS
jgi:hypothetical protein